MCGIAGVVGHGASRDVLEAQLKLLEYRGPDSHGWYAGEGAAVGQTRLAVIDLETGDPPIKNEDGSIGVALNGEIYNYRELREELLARGHRLSTQGDTEVIAHLAEDGEPVDLARKLQGMFAFAVWDGRRRRLILGRDRVGKKPLYYCACRAAFVFGSELKAVLAHPRVPRELDERAIPAYLTFGYVPTPRTFYKGIYSVPPGYVLVLEATGEPRLEQYWEPPLVANNEGDRPHVSEAEAATVVRRHLEQAVSRRLISDVPLGAFLSGGIDSSAIVALMARSTTSPVQTFTIGFEDRDGYDERAYARTIAERYGTDHHEFVVAPDAVELVERLVWHHDQPFGDSSAIPTYLLNENTRRVVTVALSGDGGDELFAGYERFSAGLAADRLAAVPAAAVGLVARALAHMPPGALRGRGGSAQRFTESAALGLPHAYREWLAFFSEDRRAALLGERDDWALRDYDEIWNSSAGADTLERLLNLNLRTYLVDDLLVKADRMSMAHGLEVRSPFLDSDLIDVALTLPGAHHIKGFSRKRVLKSAIEDLVPREILSRRKRGFGVPLDRWFREDLASYVNSLLGSSSARIRRHVAGEEVDRLLSEHRLRLRDHGQALWALLTLELFLGREGW